MKNKIFEGVRFGQKQINDILSRSEDFNIGIEYEMRINDYNISNNLTEYLRKADLMREITGIVPEHDSMTEIITKKMDLVSALRHIKGMFKFIVDNDIEIPSMAGMHISISTNKHNLDDFNTSKFLVLMNSSYLTSIFPERKHVMDIDPIIKKVLKDYHFPYDNARVQDLQKVEERILEYTREKYQTINIGHYKLYDGRIELRFFGGKNYHQRYDEIKVHLLRALLLMEVGYTDLYQKEYYKLLYKQLVALKATMSDIIPKDDYNKILKAIKSNNDIEIAKAVISASIDNGKFTSKEVYESLPSRIRNRYIDAIKNDHRFAIIHAKRIIKNPFPLGEDVIAKDAMASVNYAEFIGNRFKKGEDVILHNPITAPRYIFWLNEEEILTGRELVDLMTKLSHEELVNVFEQTLSERHTGDISFSELHSYLVSAGDREVIQAYIDAMLNLNNTTSLTYMFFLINDYQDRYNDRQGNLLTLEQTTEIINNLDGIPIVRTTARSTLLKEILDTMPNDKILEYLPLYKRYLVDEGKWSDNEYNDTYHIIKNSLLTRFAKRSDEIYDLIHELFP